MGAFIPIHHNHAYVFKSEDLCFHIQELVKLIRREGKTMHNKHNLLQTSDSAVALHGDVVDSSWAWVFCQDATMCFCPCEKSQFRLDLMATLGRAGNVVKESGVKIFQLSAKLRASLPLNAVFARSLKSVF